MNPKYVVSYIEVTPYISSIPVEPGLSNDVTEENGNRIVGLNSENEELNEGMIRFDIVFYVRMRDGLSQIIVNLEAQDCILGSCEWKGKLDLLNIVMIGLAKELPPHDDTYELHRLLGALLSKDLTVDEK